MWENVGKMTQGFFAGSYNAKLDEKNRFVLPQSLRYQLVENGELSFTIALSMGGSLAIYRKSDLDEIVERFRKNKHRAKFQKFFTLFFSTLFPTTCDSVGRVTIPKTLKDGIGIKSEIVLAGALNKIELWPKEVYERDLNRFIGGEAKGDFQSIMEEAFNMLADEDENLEETIERVQQGIMEPGVVKL